MALGGVITWLVVPVVKLTKYLTIEPNFTASAAARGRHAGGGSLRWCSSG